MRRTLQNMSRNIERAVDWNDDQLLREIEEGEEEEQEEREEGPCAKCNRRGRCLGTDCPLF